MLIENSKRVELGGGCYVAKEVTTFCIFRSSPILSNPRQGRCLSLS